MSVYFYTVRCDLVGESPAENNPHSLGFVFLCIFCIFTKHCIMGKKSSGAFAFLAELLSLVFFFDVFVSVIFFVSAGHFCTLCYSSGGNPNSQVFFFVWKLLDISMILYFYSKCYNTGGKLS